MCVGVVFEPSEALKGSFLEFRGAVSEIRTGGFMKDFTLSPRP